MSNRLAKTANHHHNLTIHTSNGLHITARTELWLAALLHHGLSNSERAQVCRLVMEMQKGGSKGLVDINGQPFVATG